MILGTFFLGCIVGMLGVWILADRLLVKAERQTRRLAALGRCPYCH